MHVDEKDYARLHIEVGKAVMENASLREGIEEERNKIWQLRTDLDLVQRQFREMRSSYESLSDAYNQVLEENRALRNPPVKMTVLLIRSIPNLHQEVIDLLREKKKIAAIKLVRDQVRNELGFTLGLKAAKFAVENVQKWLEQQEEDCPS